MDFLSLATKRYSVRDYSQKKVEEDKIVNILKAAQIAPTAANLQPVRILVLSKESELTKLDGIANIYHAPLAFIVLADKKKAWTRPFDGMNTKDIDASIVTTHMMLEACDQDLGSVWICYFKAKELKEKFNLPENLEPINILAVGYENETSKKSHLKQRISLNELCLSNS